jgi:hypothetical protein
MNRNRPISFKGYYHNFILLPEPKKVLFVFQSTTHHKLSTRIDESENRYHTDGVGNFSNNFFWEKYFI